MTANEQLNANLKGKNMGFIEWMESFFDGSRDHEQVTTINPASGLPMQNGANIDVAGNPYGTDFNSNHQTTSWPDHHHDAFNSNSGYDSGF